MSIISDALKKAQSRRHEDPAPGPGSFAGVVQAPHHIRRSKRALMRPILLLGGIFFVISVIGLSSFLYIKLSSAGSAKTVPSVEGTPETALEPDTTPAAANASAISTSPSGSKTVKTQFMRMIPEKLPILGGIMYSPQEPQAILNGKIVREGSTLDGFTVNRILRDKVMVTSGEIEHELKMP